MKKIGILHDNISGNIGDVAIGLSVKKILRKMNVEFDELVPGRFYSNDYEAIVIGGGNLIRPSPDFFYDKFKIPGNHILNTCGIVDAPSDLHFLDNYRYVSVRSTADKKKIHYLKREVKVVPCTSMLLDNVDDFSLPIEKPSIGIHLMPGFMRKEDEEQFIEWISSLGLNVYFLPVTHYNLDFIYLNSLRSKIVGSKIIPLLKAQEVFTIIGKFDYFVSSSLHGAIFSYVHNVPFIALDRYEDKKIRFFMEDRDLGQHLFTDFHELKNAFERLMKDRPDYSEKVAKDFKVLDVHVRDLERILAESRKDSRITARDERKEDEDLTSQMNYQVHHLQLLTIELNAEIDRLHEELKLREDHVKNIEELLQFRNAEIQAIHKSISWQILGKYENFLHKLFPLGTRRRHYYELILGGLRSGPSPLERVLDQNTKTDNIHSSENRDQHSSSE